MRLTAKTELDSCKNFRNKKSKKNFFEQYSTYALIITNRIKKPFFACTLPLSTDPGYNHLKATQTKATHNKLTDYDIVTRSTMIDDECIGPHDEVRLILSESKSYKFTVYENVFKEGRALDDIEMRGLLAEMNDNS